MRRALITVLLGSAALGAALPASAQTAPAPAPAGADQGVIVFAPDFFAEAAPNTAMDMINRLPGFNFEGGGGARGFAGNAGNVLIDGQRPTSKSDGLGDILNRIPASQVERIELIRGGAPGIDMQGRSVVANVVRKRTDRIQQTFILSNMTFLGTGKSMVGGRYEVSKQFGERALDGSIQVFNPMNDAVGDSVFTVRDATGAVIRRSEGGIEGDGLGGNVKLAGRTPLAGGRLSGNLMVQSDKFKDEEHVNDGARRDSFVATFVNWNTELGVNYTRPIGSKFELETLALQRLNWRDLIASGDTAAVQSRFTSDTYYGESIARAVLRWKFSDALTFEGGGEGAFNFREASVGYTQNGTPVPLPSADVRVEEQRAEAFGQATWRATPALTFEAGSRFEWSTISQTGGSARDRSFFYAKPRVTAAWSPSESDQLRLRVERELGQLDFGDFVSSVGLRENLPNVGNPDLEPHKAWVYEVAYERRFWGDGALVVTARHRDVADVIDRVPIFADLDGDGTVDRIFDAPGNIGDAKVRELRTELTLPLAKLGVDGGRLQFSGGWVDSEVTDPTTGETRRISGQRPDNVEVRFRQDLPARKLTWGVSYYAGWEETHYRFDEVAKLEIRDFFQAFVEFKPKPGTSFLIEAANLSPFVFQQERVLYDGPRDTAPVLRRESFDTQSQPRIYLRYRRTI